MSVAQLDQAISRLARLYNGGMGASGLANNADLTVLKSAIQAHSSPTLTPVPTIPALTYKQAPEKPTVEKNTLYGYAAWHYDASGDFFCDPYGDITTPGSWQMCIQDLEKQKRDTGKDALLPHLYQHNRNAPIGKVMVLKEDRRGVYYETKLARTQQAQEIRELASDGLLTTSYGFNAIVTQQVYHQRSKKMVRKLVEVDVKEISAVTFGTAANPYTSANLKSLVASGDYQTLLQLNHQFNNLVATLASQASERSRR